MDGPLNSRIIVRNKILFGVVLESVHHSPFSVVAAWVPLGQEIQKSKAHLQRNAKTKKFTRWVQLAIVGTHRSLE